MENKRNQEECRKCGGIGTPSKALVNYHFIDKSYLRGEKEFVDKLVDCIKCQSCGHSWIPQYPEETFGLTSETSTREQAIAWWNSLPDSLNNGKDKQSYYDVYKANVYTPANKFSELTGREIQNIWAVETSKIENKVFKPNQKQFKQFDESLFEAYIDKFSDEDKVAALRVLFKSIGITSKDKLEYFLARY